METKIKNFLQSDMFIFSISLALGFLCHFIVVTEIVTSNHRVQDPKTLYTGAFDFKPLLGKKLQSREYRHREHENINLQTQVQNSKGKGVSTSFENIN